MITAAEVKAYIPKLSNITTGSVATIAFVHGATEAITDSGNGFVAAGLLPGMQIVVTCSIDKTNEGVFTIVTVAAGTLIVTPAVTSKSAAQAGTVRINAAGTDYTTRIETLIPFVENKVCELCHQHFVKVGPVEGYYVAFEAAGLVFAATAKTITSTLQTFTSFQFAAGDNIYVRGSLKNDGHYTLKTVTAGVLTLEDLYTLRDETSQGIVEIYYCDIPRELKPVLARMVEYELLIKPLQNPGMASESIGGYSYSRDGREYPGEILGDLGPYTRSVFV
jgi:hypothetical protein